MRFLISILLVFCLMTPALAIRIGIADNQKYVSVGSSAGASIIDENSGKVLYNMQGMQAYVLKAHNNIIGLRLNGKDYNLRSNKVVIKPFQQGFVCAKQRWYRGYFRIVNLNGELILINEIPLEDYLRGVVPSEMPSGWAEEALKAQAIAARSYALANLGKHGSRGYDLKDNTEDQAYGGASSEKPSTNRAVYETTGIVVTYDQKIISAYYHASSGGQTVNTSDVWYKDLPYIKSVPGYDGNIKKNGHGVGMSQHGANNLAKKGYNAYQILTYFYNNISFGRLKPDMQF